MASKSSEKAQETLEITGSSPGIVGQNAQQCEAQKHWIRIAVVDSDGKPVTDIHPKLVAGSTSIDSVTLDKNGKFDTGKTLDDTTPAVISFPTLVNCDWWPSDGAAPPPAGEKAMAAITDGDCVLSLAHTQGLRSYKDIWDAPENSALKSNRPAPGIALDGDVWKAPDKKDKTVSKAVDAEWKFVVRALLKPKLRIILVDSGERKPWKGCTWNLAAGKTWQGTTFANGLLEALETDPTVKAGTLKVTPPARPKPTAPKQSKPTLPDPPPYPLPVTWADFEDEAPTTTELTTPFEFTLRIGSMPPPKDKKGVIARLRNYGFLVADNPTDEQLKQRVKAYQREVLKQATPSGVFSDIQDDLETRHTKP